jgi:hypothetical protein
MLVHFASADCPKRSSMKAAWNQDRSQTEVTQDIRCANADNAAGFCHTPKLRKKGVWLLDMFKDAVTDRDVYTLITQGPSLTIYEMKLIKQRIFRTGGVDVNPNDLGTLAAECP